MIDRVLGPGRWGGGNLFDFAISPKYLYHHFQQLQLRNTDSPLVPLPRAEFLSIS